MISSLNDVKEINGKVVLQDRVITSNGEIDWEATDIARETKPIFIDHAADMISFKMLTKPASEGGDLRQCQWSDLVATGLEQLKYFNGKFPCRENALTITKLEEALMWNEKRTQDRIKRKVEGKDSL